MNTYQSIPDEVLVKIQAHRPHLSAMIRNLRAARLPAQSRQIERAIANACLMGAVHLSPEECLKLSSCCIGTGYGE